MKPLDARLAQSVAVLLAASVVVVSWLRGYQPAVRTETRDRDRLVKLTQELSQVDATVKTDGGKDAWLEHHRPTLEKLQARFPQQTQLPQLLNALIDALKTSEMRVVNITQGNLEPVQEAGQPLLLDGAPCYRLPVTVAAVGRYHVILAALDRFTTDTFPAVVGLQQIEFQVNQAGGATLNATMILHLYVVGSAPVTSSSHP